MINKQPEEQQERRYRYRATVSVSRPVVRRGTASQSQTYDRTRLQGLKKSQGRQATAVRRRVTLPHEAIQPLSWAERHERYRQLQRTPSTYPQLVERTLSQTGRPAPRGQLRTTKLQARRGQDVPVPVRRKRRRGNGFWGRFFGFLIVLIIIVGGGSFALISSTFHIQHLLISGTQNQDLLASIQKAGIQGQDIFLFNQSALVAHLEALPLVAAISIKVQLPDTVLVKVQERVPVLLWQSSQDTFGVAQDGTIIAVLAGLDKGENVQNLSKVIDKRTDMQVHPGTRLSAQDILFVEQLFQQLPASQGVAPFTLQYRDKIVVGGRTVPANEGGKGSYVVVSANGWQAYLGDETNSNSLANRLLELERVLGLAREQHLKLATIDLRFGLRPTYTLKS